MVQIVLWEWRSGNRLAVFIGHAAPVVCMDMSLDGSRFVSGDKGGEIIVWETKSQSHLQVLAIHSGPVLCVSMSPCGTQFISSGQDEHIAVFDCESGEEISCLDEILDGKGLTAKFSFDGTRIQVIGSELGNWLRSDKDSHWPR